MLSIRPAGVVFVAAIAMEQFVFFVRRKTDFRNFAIRTGIFIILPVTVYFTLNSLLFHVPSSGSITDYFLFINSGDFLKAIPENFSHLIEVFRFLYVPEAGIFRGFALLLGSVMVAMTLFGFLKRMLHGPELTEWFFIFYIIMLLVLPNNFSSYRLMVPLGFIFLMYAAAGLKSIRISADVTTWKKVSVSAILVILLFMPGIISITRSRNNVLEGPQRETSVEAFNYISKNVPAEAVVLFAKPRALALYTGCLSMADPLTSNPTQFHIQILKARASYLLIHTNLTFDPMKRYVRVMQKRLTRQWENKDFVLYKINPVNP
jgi:hypothetical protein